MRQRRAVFAMRSQCGRRFRAGCARLSAAVEVALFLLRLTPVARPVDGAGFLLQFVQTR